MSIVDAVKKVRSFSPGTIYACDPVMGDVGRGFYVKPDIPEIFKKELIPLADIITPNQFELEAITGINTQNISGALEAVNALHKMGPSIVLVTSFKEKEGELSMIASNKKEIYKITTPELPFDKNVAGTGDMTMAVFLSRYLETKDLKKTLELCTASVFGILKASLQAAEIKNDAPIKNDAAIKTSAPIINSSPIDLKIIDNQNELVCPSFSFKAEMI